MNNNNLIESNILEPDINLNISLTDSRIISNSEIEPLKESEQVALHALLELSLDAALGELKEELVNMNMNSISGKIDMLKTFIRRETIGYVNSAPNSNPAPPTSTNSPQYTFAPHTPNAREGARPIMNNEHPAKRPRL